MHISPMHIKKAAQELSTKYKLAPRAIEIKFREAAYQVAIRFDPAAPYVSAFSAMTNPYAMAVFGLFMVSPYIPTVYSSISARLPLFIAYCDRHLRSRFSLHR